MKKPNKFIAMLTAVCLTAFMAACGSSQSGAGAAEEAASDAEEIVTEAASLAEEETVTLKGEAEGFTGTVTAEVEMLGDRIVGLVLSGEEDAKGIAAVEELTEAILEKGSIDGVDGVSGATWTSNGVFGAIRNALGIDSGSNEDDGEVTQQTAAGLSHGLGVYASGRLGPGSDDTGTGVYSFNEAVAYIVFDDEGRIMDLEIDQLEVASPNYDGEHMPDFTGFPGQGYNADEDHDEVVDSYWEQTEDSYLAEISAWKTKRERGSDYKLGSAAWCDEMDTIEGRFIGMTIDEVNEFYEKYCSDVNGKILHGTSSDESDIAKYDALQDEEKEMLDVISMATFSLNDAHGNIIGAINKAWENRVPIDTDQTIEKLGLGVSNLGRLGPGSDDTGVGVYSFNTQFTGACYNADGEIIALYGDMMEVATPNYDGENMPHLTGWPGQSYNADEDHDEVVDAVLDQTEDTFLAEVDLWRTKRERGSTYKLNSGSWADEMDIFEETFTGMTTDEVTAWYDAYCSDVNGRPLHGTSENESDIAKYDALSDDEKAALDAISGATISLTDAHGDILGSIEDAWERARVTYIEVAK